jgi:hypothetical protein
MAKETMGESIVKLRLQMSIALKKLERLEDVLSQVKDNTWWINKIKIGFVTITIFGVILGIVRYALS